MSVATIPPHYVKREDAESAIGKSPKTIYRHIKKAIECDGSNPKTGRLKGLLDHCLLELLDGEIIGGRDVTGMEQIDRFRSDGRVPTWHIDPDKFTEYFQSRVPPSDASKKSEERKSDTAPRMSDEHLDARIIEQYEERLKEKEERIGELMIDKNELRQQLSSVTELTNKITGLLGHSQLKALGLPTTAESNERRDNETRDRSVIMVDRPQESTPASTPGAAREQDTAPAANPNSPEKGSEGKPKSRKTARKKKSAAKPKKAANKQPPPPEPPTSFFSTSMPTVKKLADHFRKTRR